jgi:N-acetylneuraminic acid mutarotase
MVERRDDATATLLNNGKVLIVGGVNQDVTSGSAELFDYTNNTFTKVPTGITPRHFHTATLLNDGRVLIVGGLAASTDTAQTLTDAQLYDPTTNTFTPTGALHVARFYQMATKLPDGRVLVAGGYNGGGATATAEVYGPLADQIFKNGFD